MKIPDRRIELFTASGTASASGTGTGTRTTPGTDSASRFSSPATGDEKTMLVAILAAQRATLQLKCSGLEAELAVRSVPPSSLSLLGLVRHLADVERRWFRAVLAGHDVELRFSSAEAPEGDFDGSAPDPETVAESWAAWDAEVAFAESFAAEAPHLDVEGHDAWRGAVSLRWVLIHMIEEYARHNGHADLIRERIDGAVGL
ncbi:DinB family protein [Streptomyces sp. SJL17-1]|uniref:DinB family protein n=1 Tax=Streptomyces sp. SJL17-1 TaxID=2967223 RepID=UPI0029677151|nr:DinB family protein [Streptomyces sp. SJL17-1]